MKGEGDCEVLLLITQVLNAVLLYVMLRFQVLLFCVPAHNALGFEDDIFQPLFSYLRREEQYNDKGGVSLEGEDEGTIWENTAMGQTAASTKRR